MSNRMRRLLLIASAVSTLCTSPAWAKVNSDTENQPVKIPQLSDIDHPATTVEQWLSQAAIQVTNVRVNSTEKGLEVILETTQGEQLQPVNKSEGNNFIADIPNAQLRLSGDNVFRQDKPLAGITGVIVTNLDANTIRVTVTGEAGLPTVELSDSPNEGLIFEVIPVASSAPQTQQPSSNQPNEPAAQREEPIELVVTGEQEGYSVSNTTTGTRTDTPLRDIPQSIQVVPRQVLDDRQVTSIGEALENVSGVVNQGSYSGFDPALTLRGFDVGAFQGQYFRDGSRLFVRGFPQTFNLERLEVLKGPASVLYGQAEVGGIINLVSKLPRSEPFYSVFGTIGSFDTYEGAFDFSGPLNEKKTVQYRLNALYSNTGSFRDFVEGEKLLIAPVISWTISPNTSLTIDGEFSDISQTIDDGIPAIGNRPADIPRSRFLNEPFSNYDKKEYSIGYVFNHQFNNNLSVRNSFRAQWIDDERYYPYTSSLNETTGELSRESYYSGGYYENYSSQTDLIGKFATGAIKHQLLLGFEYAKTVESPEFGFGDYPSINIFNPVYARQKYPKSPIFFRDDTTTSLGFYLQDQVEVSPNLKLVFGGRFDSFDQNRSTRDLGDPKQEFEQSDSEFSPRLGIVYQPNDAVSLYAAYTRSFKPSFGASRNFDNSVFKPEKGTQYEIGVKTDFLNGRLNAILAGYILTKQNVTTTDPVNSNFSIQTGEQTSKGIELDITGEIRPGWKIIASAAYIDASITEDNTFQVGNRLANVAETSASLWTTYELQRGDAKGLGFGLGLYYVGDRFGDLDNSYILPNYFRTDAALFYRRDNWKAQLNIKNLFDVEYFAGSDGGRTRVQPGAPFTILGTLAVEF